jgi:hypothetical protein
MILNPSVPFRFLCVLGCFLTAACSTTEKRGTTEPNQSGISPRNSTAGFTFPARVGNFVRRGPVTFDDAGDPIGTYWAGALALANVYYYKTSGHSLEREFADCRDYVKVITPGARLLASGEVVVNAAGHKHRGFKAVFRFPPNSRTRFAGAMKSQLLIFQLRDRFVKFRVTYSWDHADRVEEELHNFLSDLAWPERLESS